MTMATDSRAGRLVLAGLGAACPWLETPGISLVVTTCASEARRGIVVDGCRWGVSGGLGSPAWVSLSCVHTGLVFKGRGWSEKLGYGPQELYRGLVSLSRF
jgi:hypothetical protein